jgi:SAM-dependent methyltransferase
MTRGPAGVTAAEIREGPNLERRARAGATLCAMRERWIEEITARAAAFWTPERRRGLLGEARLILPPVEAAPLLRALGLLRGDGSMAPESVRKYMQINHVVGLLEPLLIELARARPVVRVLDVACGSSSLTLLLAWCFANRWSHPAQVVGVDRNAAVIERCRERAPAAGLEELVRFEAATIGELDVGALWARAFPGGTGGEGVDALFALHACDTATDEALALGVATGAGVIGVVPCCQAELARAWTALAERGVASTFSPVWRAPHLRREAAATMTDALRMLLMRGCGYEVTPMEFVPSEHTPKNTLLRCVRRGPGPHAEAALDAYVALRSALGGATIRLEELLPAAERERLSRIGAPVG